MKNYATYFFEGYAQNYIRFMQIVDADGRKGTQRACGYFI